MRAVLAVLLASTLVLALSPSALAIGSGFIENRGQIDEQVLYYALSSRMAVYFTQDAVVFNLMEPAPLEGWKGADLYPNPFTGREPHATSPRRGCAVHMRFEAANPFPRVEARSKLEARYNYFLGSDPSKWRTDVSAYSEIIYHDLWPGVDLLFRDGGDRLTYDLVVTGEPDLSEVRFTYQGADRVVAVQDGSCRIETPAGSFTDARPIANGRSGVLAAGDVVCGEEDMAKSLAREDAPMALGWSTYVGGSSTDIGSAVVLDSWGNPVVTGYTGSAAFPTTVGAYDISHNGGQDVFVAKLSKTGSDLLWSTFLGGGGYDRGYALAIDPSGSPIVAGYTGSALFPTTSGAYDVSHNGNDDVFVAKLSNSGSALLWSTLLGGNDHDRGYALVLSSSGDVILTGTTRSSGFPTTVGAYDISHNGGYDAFVACLSSTGSDLLWSTFLGGAMQDYGYAMILNSSGDPVVTGTATSTDFPTTPGAYDTSNNGGYDVFVANLSEAGSTLLWSTLLGGDGNEHIQTLAEGLSGDLFLAGSTFASGFPTTPGAYDTSFSGTPDSPDVFVAELSGTGSALLWSTYLGGSLREVAYGVTLDPAGNPILIGETASPDFPTTPEAYDTSFGGSTDVFMAKLLKTGSTLLWSTFLGGANADEGYALALDPWGDLVFTGFGGGGFPTTPGAYDESHNGNQDVFVAKMDLPPQQSSWTWHVLQDGTGDATTIGAGIDLALAGDTVLVGAGIYSEHDLSPRNGVVLLIVSGPGATIIDAQGLGRVFHCANVDSTTEIRGFTIRNGWAELGAGMLCESSSPDIRDCIFSNNTGENPLGGGIALVGSSPRLTDCVFYENGALSGGAVYCENSSLRVSGCTVVANLALSGSALYCKDASVVSMENTIVAFNQGMEPVTCATGSSASLSCCDVYGNEGGDWIGCIAGQQGMAGNFSADPLFCAAWHYMYDLYPESPCAAENNPSCGLVGALPSGCDFTGVAGGGDVSRAYALSANWPNPFNPSTSIRFALPERAAVDLTLYDTAGRRVAVLASGVYEAGEHMVSWGGHDGAGREAPSGIYFACLRAGDFTATRKLVLIR